MSEHVIVVDEHNHPIGTQLKGEVHGVTTVLHRGFSVFIFDGIGRFLIQQRAGTKQTWPLVWSNSCCGHPQLDETPIEAVQRRIREELRILDVEIHEVIPDYRYQAVFNGIMENEFCPVYVAWTDEVPDPNETEVAAVRWIQWSSFIDAITGGDDHDFRDFSVWSLEEAVLLNDSPVFQKLWIQNVNKK